MKNKPTIEADLAAETHRKSLKKKASEPIPPGRLAALIAHLDTKERKQKGGIK